MLKPQTKSFLKYLFVIGLFFALSKSAHAADADGCWEGITGGCYSFEDMKGLILKMVNIFVYVLPATICLFYLMYAGYISITAKGNPTQLQKSKETATWAVLGLIVIVTAYLIVNVFSLTFLGGPVQIIGN